MLKEMSFLWEREICTITESTKLEGTSCFVVIGLVWALAKKKKSSTLQTYMLTDVFKIWVFMFRLSENILNKWCPAENLYKPNCGAKSFTKI